jgi:hypothetical protein
MKYGGEWLTSGGIHSGVPPIMSLVSPASDVTAGSVADDSVDSRAVLTAGSVFRLAAMPKSTSLMAPLFLRRMLADLMSRWMMFLECR